MLMGKKSQLCKYQWGDMQRTFKQLKENVRKYSRQNIPAG